MKSLVFISCSDYKFSFCSECLFCMPPPLNLWAAVAWCFRFVRPSVRACVQGHSRPACRRHLVFFADESQSLFVLVVSLLFHEDLAVSRACVGSQRRAMGDSRSPYGLAVRHCRLRPDGDAVALRHSSTALENQRRGVVSTRLQHVLQHSIERVQQLKKR